MACRLTAADLGCGRRIEGNVFILSSDENKASLKGGLREPREGRRHRNALFERTHEWYSTENLLDQVGTKTNQSYGADLGGIPIQFSNGSSQ